MKYSKQAEVYAEVYSNYKNSHAYVKMKCKGSDFVTPIEGFFISQRYHVYNSSDFTTLYLEENVYHVHVSWTLLAISICSGLTVICIFIFILYKYRKDYSCPCRCRCCRSSRSSDYLSFLD